MFCQLCNGNINHLKSNPLLLRSGITGATVLVVGLLVGVRHEESVEAVLHDLLVLGVRGRLGAHLAHQPRSLAVIHAWEMKKKVEKLAHGKVIIMHRRV